LIIREEIADGQERKHVNEIELPGTSSIFNLDQELSKLFVGGFPVYFGMQPEIKYQAFEGQIEELVIGETPVSLWNFVDAENNVGSIERYAVFLYMLLEISFNFKYRTCVFEEICVLTT
jgi:laminin alpha 3/5